MTPAQEALLIAIAERLLHDSIREEVRLWHQIRFNKDMSRRWSRAFDDDGKEYLEYYYSSFRLGDGTWSEWVKETTKERL